MKRYTAAKARAQLSSLLDAAEDGEVVAIERRGVRFTLRSEKRPRQRRSKRAPKLAAVDRRVLAGEWTWSSGVQGLRLRRKPAR
jgi:antitoxin (DNA-binding transcriptional repressor) of toxin-antitoxin stability system